MQEIQNDTKPVFGDFENKEIKKTTKLFCPRPCSLFDMTPPPSTDNSNDSLYEFEKNLKYTEDASNDSVISSEYNSSSDKLCPKKHRTRAKWTREQLYYMETSFTENPFPKKKERDLLSDRISVPKDKLRNWFQNKRARERNKLKKVEGTTDEKKLKMDEDVNEYDKYFEKIRNRDISTQSKEQVFPKLALLNNPGPISSESNSHFYDGQVDRSVESKVNMNTFNYNYEEYPKTQRPTGESRLRQLLDQEIGSNLVNCSTFSNFDPTAKFSNYTSQQMYNHNLKRTLSLPISGNISYFNDNGSYLTQMNKNETSDGTTVFMHHSNSNYFKNENLCHSNPSFNSNMCQTYSYQNPMINLYNLHSVSLDKNFPKMGSYPCNYATLPQIDNFDARQNQNIQDIRPDICSCSISN
ncbi:hypothetical protein A3Q56_02333 [Intoshia linei]|uniref:Homeobox domain-containing protein n=1 Tax=Intoshia linei TaxID=1819745 RepID=A0A177B8F4_9BILA|nr:hypothetical protein A3Q56_02333 [Intoshia linei]